MKPTLTKAGAWELSSPAGPIPASSAEFEDVTSVDENPISDEYGYTISRSVVASFFADKLRLCSIELKLRPGSEGSLYMLVGEEDRKMNDTELKLCVDSLKSIQNKGGMTLIEQDVVETTKS